MTYAEFGLRLVGAFYVFAGFVATQAALSSHVIDKAIAAIGGRSASRVERTISTWHLSAATLVMASGLALLLLLDVAPWLFLASAAGQAAYIWIVAPRWFDLENPPNPTGRRQTTNAFALYSSATALVFWADWRGMLVPWTNVEWPWLVAAGAGLATSGAYALRTTAWSPVPSANSPASKAPPILDAAAHATQATRVKVMAARECHPLWALDEELSGDLPPSDLGVSNELAHDLLDWADAFTAMIVAAQDADREPSEAELAAHDVEGRSLAARLARERPDLTIYVDEPGKGLVEVRPHA